MVNTHFQVGTKVALITNSGWGDCSISQREVSKVRKDGKFFVSFMRGSELVHSEQMWTPDRYGSPRAKKSGGSSYSREHIEVWTEEHDKELAQRRLLRAAQDKKTKLIEALTLLNMHKAEDRAIIGRLKEAYSELIVARGVNAK